MAWFYLKCPDCDWHATTRSSLISTQAWAEHYAQEHAGQEETELEVPC